MGKEVLYRIKYVLPCNLHFLLSKVSAKGMDTALTKQF